jgi:hypothetical protein
MNSDWLLPLIREIHEKIRLAVTEACESSPRDGISAVVEDGEGDTIYAVDRISESLLVELFEKEIASRAPILLIAEGCKEKIGLPAASGIRSNLADHRDPIDQRAA